MDDEQTIAAVPGQGDEGTAPEASVAQTEQKTEQVPPNVGQQAQPVSSLSREEVADLIREQLSQFAPEVAKQFATKGEIEQFAQRVTDKRFANLMKKLAPEMKAIDGLVKRGILDADTARNQKNELFLESAAELGGADEEPPAPIPQPQRPQQQAQQPLPPQYNPQAETQKTAVDLLQGAGLTWEDVLPDMAQWKKSHGGQDVPLSAFATMVATKTAAKTVAAQKANWMKEYEAQIKSVKKAEKEGATTPPPTAGAPVDDLAEKKKKFKNSGRVGDYLMNLKDD